MASESDDAQMVTIDRKEVERPDSGEEMSETEMRVQVEQNEIYKLNRELLKMGGEEVLISRFTGLKQKQRKEEEEMLAKMIESESTSAGKTSKATIRQGLN